MEDEIQDAVPQLLLPASRPVSPFKYSVPRRKPRRGVVFASVVALDLLLAIVGTGVAFMISFQGYADNGRLLAPEQIWQSELLGGVVAAVLIATLVWAFWAEAYVTVLLQFVCIFAVLLLTASAVHNYRHDLPYSDTPSVQPTSTSTYIPCFSGSNGPGCN